MPKDPAATGGTEATSERELGALIDFTQAVTHSIAKAEIVEAAARFLQERCAAPALAIHDWSQARGPELAHAIGWSEAQLSALQAYLVPQLGQDDSALRQGLEVEHGGLLGSPPIPLTAIVPVMAKDVLLGALSVELQAHFPLSIRTLKAMGRQLALSLHNRQLLAQAEEALASLRQAQESIGTSEKLAAVGLLAAGIAHEINNPAAFIITNLTVLSEYISDLNEYGARIEQLCLDHAPGAKPAIERIRIEFDVDYLSTDTPDLIARCLKGMHRIHDIVRDMKSFAHKGAGCEEWTDLNQLIEQVLKVAGAELRHRAVVEVDLRPIPQLFVESTKLIQVLLNLIINAYQSFGPGPKSENKVSVASSRVDGRVRIMVADNGVGMSDEVRSRIFEPFYTTKPVGTGSGLGLAVSYEVIKRLGGHIRVESKRGRGTRFWVELVLRSDEGGPGLAWRP